MSLIFFLSRANGQAVEKKRREEVIGSISPIAIPNLSADFLEIMVLVFIYLHFLLKFIPCYVSPTQLQIARKLNRPSPRISIFEGELLVETLKAEHS